MMTARSGCREAQALGEMRRDERRKELGPMAAHGGQDSTDGHAAGSRLSQR